MNFTISDIKIRKAFTEGRLKAICSVTICEAFALHDLKIIENNDKLFVAMPSRKDENGIFRDVFHPLTADVRDETERIILEEYTRYILSSEEQ